MRTLNRDEVMKVWRLGNCENFVGTEPLYFPECIPYGAICLNSSVIKKCVNVDQKQQLNN